MLLKGNNSNTLLKYCAYIRRYQFSWFSGKSTSLWILEFVVLMILSKQFKVHNFFHGESNFVVYPNHEIHEKLYFHSSVVYKLKKNNFFIKMLLLILFNLHY